MLSTCIWSPAFIKQTKAISKVGGDSMVVSVVKQRLIRELLYKNIS